MPNLTVDPKANPLISPEPVSQAFPHNNFPKSVLIGILIFVLLSVTAYGAYWYRQNVMTTKTVPAKLSPTEKSSSFNNVPTPKLTAAPIDETANWKTYKFSPTISFKLPQGVKDPLNVNAGRYARETDLPGNTTFQIWGADGSSPSGGKDYYDEIKQSVTNNQIFKSRTIQLNNKEAIEFITNLHSSEMIWGGEIYLRLKGILIKMHDGRGLVAIHYMGQTLQKSGNFENDDLIFNQILSTFRFD